MLEDLPGVEAPGKPVSELQLADLVGAVSSLMELEGSELEGWEEEGSTRNKLADDVREDLPGGEATGKPVSELQLADLVDAVTSLKELVGSELEGSEEGCSAGNKLADVVLEDLPGGEATRKPMSELQLVDLVGAVTSLKELEGTELEGSEEGGSAGNKLADVVREDLPGCEATGKPVSELQLADLVGAVTSLKELQRSELEGWEEGRSAGNKLTDVVLEDLPGGEATGKPVFELQLTDLVGAVTSLKEREGSELDGSEEGGSAGNKLSDEVLEDLPGVDAAGKPVFELQLDDLVGAVTSMKELVGSELEGSEEGGSAGNKLADVVLEDLPGVEAAGKPASELQLADLVGAVTSLMELEGTELEGSEEGGSAGNKLADVVHEDLPGGEAAGKPVSELQLADLVAAVTSLMELEGTKLEGWEEGISAKNKLADDVREDLPGGEATGKPVSELQLADLVDAVTSLKELVGSELEGSEEGGSAGNKLADVVLKDLPGGEATGKPGSELQLADLLGAVTSLKELVGSELEGSEEGGSAGNKLADVVFEDLPGVEATGKPVSELQLADLVDAVTSLKELVGSELEGSEEGGSAGNKLADVVLKDLPGGEATGKPGSELQLADLLGAVTSLKELVGSELEGSEEGGSAGNKLADVVFEDLPGVEATGKPVSELQLADLLGAVTSLKELVGSELEGWEEGGSAGNKLTDVVLEDLPGGEATGKPVYELQLVDLVEAVTSLKELVGSELESWEEGGSAGNRLADDVLEDLPVGEATGTSTVSDLVFIDAGFLVCFKECEWKTFF